MTSDELDAWVKAYIDFQSAPGTAQHPEHGQHPSWWAVEKFFNTVHEPNGSEDCWKAILEILRRDPPEVVLGMLGAGALEDLIEQDGPAFIDRIEVEAAKDSRFRDLLRYVWQSSTPEVWKRIEVACRRDVEE